MPTQLRPNGIGDSVTTEDFEDDNVIGTCTQTTPDATQAVTILEFWEIWANESENDALTMTFTCQTGYYDEAGDPVLGTVVGDPYVVTIPGVGMDNDPASKSAKFMWIDRTVPQAALYFVTVARTGAGLVNGDTAQSAALTTVGP